MPGSIFPILQTYLAGRFPGAVASDFKFLTSGWESDVYSFSLHEAPGKTTPLILRLFPGDDVAQKVADEAHGLTWLRQVGYPVPTMRLFETEGSILGKPFSIQEKFEGQTVWASLFGTSPNESQLLLDRFCALIAWLHRLDWRSFCADSAAFVSNPARCLADWCASQRLRIRNYEVPGFLPVIDWLEHNIPPGGIQPVLVHRDFHANNVLLNDEGSLCVIDWTQVGVFDYRADLSWTLLIMGEFGQPQWAEQILKGYQRHSGRSVDHLPYFDGITYFKQLVDTVILLKSGMGAIGLNPVKTATIEQQAPLLRRYSQRLAQLTGIKVGEVEDLIR